MSKILKIWLWLSVMFTVGGAVLLYPIGSTVLNAVFILIKIGMIAGLIILISKKKKFGLYMWAVFSAGAVIMTIIKWNIVGSASLLFIISIVVDICMPAVAFLLLKKERYRA